MELPGVRAPVSSCLVKKPQPVDASSGFSVRSTDQKIAVNRADEARGCFDRLLSFGHQKYSRRTPTRIVRGSTTMRDLPVGPAI